MIDLVNPFALPFMARALVTLLVLAVAAGTVGVIVNLRRLEFMSDGLTHAVFPGLVIGFIAAGSPGLLPGALVAALISAVLLSLLSRRSGDQNVIAIVLTSFFSLGIVVVSTMDGYSGQLTEMLFGRLLSVTDAQAVITAVLVAAAVLLVALTWRKQVFRAFDRSGSAAAGIRTTWLDIAANGAVAMFVVAAAAAVGTLLVLAVLIVPAASARLLTRTIAPAVVVATVIAALGSWLGLSLSWHLSIELDVQAAPGATVALTLVALYALAVVASLLLSKIRRVR
ncbi:metal ABC transporter permease [Agrococcus casei]|uniref:Putative ABC transport system membrane protein n=1 Tax=Agrococcus casei LMG 22410 TaxID=1255656 RepID=A0A1R4ES53_9MICO|nr:metal ABC transporter permease [Agrococcus casei]SJM46396.1 Putative ABC transport system membrane protein [Agrococcus casei LMG 22410]